MIQNKLIDTENQLVVTWGEGGWAERKMDDKDQLFGDGWSLDLQW